jgi:pentatricopeptide repeat domain-containing protein 1
MLDAGVEANVVSYNAVINACAKAGEQVQAEAWLSRMTNAGVQPNAISYNAVLDACAKSGDSEKSATTFEAMKDAGIVPTIVTYASFARPFARKGVWRKVEEIQSQLQADGLGVNEHFLSIALSAYARARPKQPKRADRTFREALSNGVVPNDFVLTSLESAVGSQVYASLLSELKVEKPTGKGGGKGKGNGKGGSKGKSKDDRQ